MHNDALNSLKALVLSAQIEDAARLKAVFEHYLGRALERVHPSDYVEDCLFQIDHALAAFSANVARGPEIHAYLLGAIEALRDELELCDVHTDVRQTVVGF